MKKMKKAVSLIAAAVMVFALAVPVSASSMAGIPFSTDAVDTVIPEAVNGVIKLERDVVLEETYVVSADETVTLDLNGHTISMKYGETNKAITANHEMILNKGDLTIKDSSSEKTGAIVYEYIGLSTSTSGYASNTITSSPGSSLVVESGTIQNKTATSGQISYVIDSRTNGSGGDVSLTIKGGTFLSAKGIGIRGCLNSTTNKVTIDVTGGSFVGGVQLQDTNGSKNLGSLTIENAEITSSSYAVYLFGNTDASGIELNVKSGTFTSTDSQSGAAFYLAMAGSYVADSGNEFNATISGGTFNGNTWFWPWMSDEEDAYTFDDVITGGTYDYDMTVYTVNGYECVEQADGTFVVCNHSAERVVVDAVTATCTTAGYTGDKVCGNCGKLFETGKAIEATGHTHVNGVCACGNKIEVKVETEVVDTITKEEVKVEEVKEVTVVEDENTVKAEISVNAETTAIATEVLTATDVKETEAVKSGAITEETAEAVKEATLAGETIKTEIVVTEVKTELVPTSAQANIEKAAATVGKNAEVVQYLDVEVVLKAASTGKELGTVNVLKTPIKITIAIPENLKGENVKYVVIRDHEGVITKLPTTVNANETITFETDSFSTYALAVADADATAPKTGDAGMMPAAWVAIIAVAGVAFVAARRRSVVR